MSTRLELSLAADELDERFKRARNENDVETMSKIVHEYEFLRTQVATLLNRPLRPLEEFVEIANKILEPYTEDVRKQREFVGLNAIKHEFRWITDFTYLKREAAKTHMELFHLLNVDARHGLHNDMVFPTVLNVSIDMVNDWLGRHGCETRLTWGYSGIEWEQYSVLEMRR